MPSPGTTIELVKGLALDSGGASARDLPTGLAMTKTESSIGSGTTLVHVRFTVTEAFTLFTGADNASKGGGTKIYDFPAGIIVPLGTIFDLVLSDDLALGETTAGEIGLGSVVASGAVAVLSGTATFEDFATGQTLDNITADATIDADFNVGGAAPIGTLTGSADLYLNLATAFSDEASAHSVVVDSGTIDIWYIHTKG